MLKINTDVHNDGSVLNLRSFVDPLNETYIVNSLVLDYTTFKTSLKFQIEYYGFVDSTDTIMNNDNSNGRYYFYDYYKQIQLFITNRRNQINPGYSSLFNNTNHIGIAAESLVGYLDNSDQSMVGLINSDGRNESNNVGLRIDYTAKTARSDNIAFANEYDTFIYKYNSGLLALNIHSGAILKIYFDDSNQLAAVQLVNYSDNRKYIIINIPDDQSYFTFVEQATDLIRIHQYNSNDGEATKLFDITDDILGDSHLEMDYASASNIKNYYIDDSVLKTLGCWFFKEHDDDLDADFYHIKAFSIELTDYDNSNISYTVNQLNLDWDDFKHYLNFPNYDFNNSKLDWSFIPYIKTINDTQYLFIVLNLRSTSTTFKTNSGLTQNNVLIYSFIYDEANDKYNYISHNIFHARYYDGIAAQELFGLDDIMVLTEIFNNNVYFSPITFNGVEWELNRTIRSKLSVLRVRDHLLYVDQNNDLIVDKYIAKPKIFVKFEDENYTYINDNITTKIFVRSNYYLKTVASRIRITIISNNAEIINCCNHCKSFDVEMYDSEYPLDLLITNIGEVRIDATLIGLYELKDGLIRNFNRELTIKFDHKLERVWE